jgi:DNA polymerase III alpha subunit (gram-positive type)
MILLALDFETTGLDTTQTGDDVIEFGAVLYSTTQKKCLDNQGSLVKTDKVVTQEITEITGITQAAVNRFGYDQESVLETIFALMEDSDAIIGKNVRRFDQPLLYSWASRHGRIPPVKVWIDIEFDLPWRVPVSTLSHMAADHGILNLFPHSALADCQTTLAIAAKYDADLLLKRAQSPVVVLRSLEPMSNKDAVKKAKFRWSPGRKIWWKPVKETDVEEVLKSIKIQAVIEKEITQEELDR